MAVLSLWRRVLAVAMSAALLLAVAPALPGAPAANLGLAAVAAEAGAPKALPTAPSAADDPAPADSSAGPPGCSADSCPHLDLLHAPDGPEPAQIPSPARRAPAGDRDAPAARPAGPERPPRT